MQKNVDKTFIGDKPAGKQRLKLENRVTKGLRACLAITKLDLDCWYYSLSCLSSCLVPTLFTTHTSASTYEAQTAAVLFSPALETNQDVSTLERLVERRVHG